MGFLVSDLRTEWKRALHNTTTVRSCLVFTHSLNVPYVLSLLRQVAYPPNVPLYIMYHRWSFKPHHTIKTAAESRKLKATWARQIIDSPYDLRLLRILSSKNRMHCKAVFLEDQDGGLDAIFYSWNLSFAYNQANQKPHLLYHGLPWGWQDALRGITDHMVPFLDPVVEAGNVKKILQRLVRGAPAPPNLDSTTQLFLFSPHDFEVVQDVKRAFQDAGRDDTLEYYRPHQRWRHTRVTVHSSFVHPDVVDHRCQVLRVFLHNVPGEVRVVFPAHPDEHKVNEKVMYRAQGNRVAWLYYTTSNFTRPSYSHNQHPRTYRNFEVGLLHFPTTDHPLAPRVVRRLRALGEDVDGFSLDTAPEKTC